MTDSYYLISDLHIGGDEQLGRVDFLDELLSFLRTLEASDEDAELIINGDAFGLWEFTDVDGLDKFDALVDRYPELFEQFEATGDRIPITLIPGNHDYELAAYPEYVDRLAEFNVTLRQEVSLTRNVGDHVLYVEHGMQRDPNNRIPDFGNPYANPPGYFVNRQLTSRAGRLSERGKFNWLKDIQAVTPMTQIPAWMLSNYFYREMSPWLRYVSAPFLLLFNVGFLYVLAFALDATGLWSLPMDLIERFLGLFGPVGLLVDVLLTANLAVTLLLILVAIPLFVFARDVRKTLRRFGIDQPDERDSADTYLEGARALFASDPAVAVFVYGHTHRPAVTEIDGRVVVNTGTWLKRLRRVESAFGVLPPVFYSWYQLNYVRVSATEDGGVAVDYELVAKQAPDEETWFQRLVTPAPKRDDAIPPRTVVRPTGEPSEADAESDPSGR
ncbi:phosphoesterase [Haloferax sp. Atlit-6N]|uniref:Metallophosphoesterase n=1 Tax=Haloferax gibbonsii (strain ATCC 33959 / DSM 4427 / JCM 8863 / NBRC 102184 / NCIMB 2188 / Ma 2.38) TaxID=1227459 RepID=M0GU50_HALGM|nr:MULTISPECIES: metallophosphoesterase [Haloferax]ELZ75756.1 metallophosphoesterase [Haloferax gibbonsii ATCC 33959]REA01496.1 phosphoesterase [Haloferax sp. Atlit-6N]